MGVLGLALVRLEQMRVLAVPTVIVLVRCGVFAKNQKAIYIDTIGEMILVLEKLCRIFNVPLDLQP